MRLLFSITSTNCRIPAKKKEKEKEKKSGPIAGIGHIKNVITDINSQLSQAN
jgi:hypothetical protein